jgi:hypothetical protein
MPLASFALALPLALASFNAVAGTVGLFFGIASVAAALYAIRQGSGLLKQLRDQVDRMAATETALNQTQHRIAELSRDLYAVVNLTQDAAQVDGLLSNLRAIAGDYADIATNNHTFLSDFVRRTLTDLTSHTHRAKSGFAELTAEDLSDQAAELADYAIEGDTLIATSYVNTTDFWGTPAAARYLQVNENLIKTRGVEIIRIFLFADEEAAAASIPEMTKQANAGVTVRTALTPRLETSLKRDMFLLGDRLAAEYDLTNDRSDILRLRVWHRPQSEVDAVIRRMRKLVQSSTLFTPPAVPIASNGT